jgi:catechol 2,3-dioxygenase-like lactoylglutathione lyase family enzyme
MALHSLAKVTIGVPNVAETCTYYEEFGLKPLGDGRFGTRDGGEQLEVTYQPKRRLVEMTVGVDDWDDLLRTAGQIESLHLGVGSQLDGSSLRTVEPATGVVLRLVVRQRIEQSPTDTPGYNGPGRIDRRGRAAGILRSSPVQPRKLGHAVIATTDLSITTEFFTHGLGFKISDRIGDKGVFMRCSIEHHNVLALAAPVHFLHHTSWQVDDVDDIGRGATQMLHEHPERHVWGLGRHHAGSNFFWYLKDPAGNFCEYYSDMDCIPDDEIWTPETFEGAKGLFNWGPPPPPSFLAPDDLADLMIGSHTRT